MEQSKQIEILECNAEQALDFDDTTIVVPLTLARNIVAQLEAENERLQKLEENLRDAWPVINGVLVVPPDGILENHDVAGHILDVLFEALEGKS